MWLCGSKSVISYAQIPFRLNNSAIVSSDATCTSSQTSKCMRLLSWLSHNTVRTWWPWLSTALFKVYMKLLKQLIDEFLISLCLYLYFFNCFSNTLPECHTLLLRKDAMLLILRQLRDLSGVRATKGVHENNVHGIGITMLTHIQQKKNIYSLHSITKRASW